jgi:hypothetical protein
MKKYIPITLIVTFLTIILISCTPDGIGGGSTVNSLSDYVNKEGLKTGKTFISIYMQTSTSDKKNDFLLDDLKEILSGFDKLSYKEKANIGFYIAFSGSKNDFLNYADVSCLLKDSGDNILGNDSCYDKTLKSTDIKNNLSEFIISSSKKALDYDRSILIFWSQNSNYLSSGSTKLINLSDITQALKSVSFKWDIVAFDQSLSANIELAKAIKDNSNYLIASQGYEPKHGFDYEDIVNLIANNTQDTVIDIGTKIVDSYINSKKHKDTTSKTLSLIDLSLISEAEKNISDLSINLKENLNYVYPYIIKILSNTSHFAKSNVTNIDMVSFFELLKQSNLMNYSINLDLIKKLVVYHKEDLNSNKLNGLSISSLNNFESIKKKFYIEENSLSSDYFQLTNDFYHIALTDNSPPLVEGEQNCIDGNGIPNNCFKSMDNTGIKNISYVKTKKSLDNTHIILSYQMVKNLGNNYYSFQNWNGDLLNICSDINCQNSLVIPTYSENVLLNGNKSYTSECIFNDKKALFSIEFDSSNKIITHSIFPYSINDSDEIVFSKEQYKIKKGDSISFVYDVLDLNYKTKSSQEGEKIEFESSPYFEKNSLQERAFYFSLIEDVKGNIETTSVLENNF